MKQKKDAVQVGLAAPEICACRPLSAQYPGEGDGSELYEGRVLATEALQSKLRLTLKGVMRSQPLSVLALHIVQLEHMNLDVDQGQSRQRRRYHAPSGLLDQVLANVRRVTREGDPLLLQRESGAVMLFPGVDARGIAGILERVYNNIALLQAETVIPPLALETIFQLGVSSYPMPASTLEMVLDQAGRVARQFVLRPAITAQQPIIQLSPRQPDVVAVSDQQVGGVPFMELPHVLPRRLTQLIPYHIAVRLRCVPVGRHQRYLTVAMSNPRDRASVGRLQELTGLHIFPVSCREEDLSLLLKQGW